MDGKIVRPETVLEMWTPAKVTGGGKGSNYGPGFGVLMLDGGKYVAHSGGQQGTTAMVIIPEKHFAVAALANLEDAEPFEVVRGILEQFNMPYPTPAKK
ncbi:MAG: hypothetical protein LAP87_02155 [Acidobacteriia bacterium]|nr:hypothetical protein [Terriglobia bacterium]